jgi:glycosyltransferase involved in cell wall biosynthesis
MPTVSVVIPTYNRADLLSSAIDSELAQSCPASEILVVDDGSTDTTAQVVMGYGHPVQYLQLPHTGLPAATRNAGIRAATGDLLAFLDSDDLFLPDKLALQTQAMAQMPEAGLVYSDALFFRTQPTEPVGHVLDGLPSPTGWVLPQLLVGNFLAPPAVLVRRTALESVGFFNENPDFFAVEDFDLWLRLAEAFPFTYIPGDVAAIRRHPGGISRNTARLRQGVLAVLAAFDRRSPAASQQYRTARHEAYALSHAAVATAEAHARCWRPAAWHTLQAVSHLVRLPGLGLPAVHAWRHRSKIRRDAAR